MLGDSFGNVEVWGVARKYYSRFNSTNPITMINHYNPADVSDETLEKIANRAIELYRAMGLHTSFADIELILDSAGEIHPLEIGARSSGFICSDLMDAINPSRVFVNEYLDVIRGKKIGNGYTAHKDLSSMYIFYDLGDCTIKRESNLMEFLPRTIKNLYHDRSVLKVGSHLRIPSRDSERTGFEILCGARKDLTIEAIFDAQDRFAEFAVEKESFENPLILLGGNPLFLGMLNLEKFHAKEIIVFDWRDNPPIKGDLHVQMDIKDSARIIDWLDKHNIRKIRGAITMNDVGVPTQRKIHEHYGFLVPTEKSINDAMVKGRATKIWREAGLLTRFSQTFETLPNIDELPQKDLIVKPNFSNASNGITIIRKDSREDFERAFKLAREFSLDNKVIIEEFINTFS